MSLDRTRSRLQTWFADRLGVDAVTVEDFEEMPTGHSAETVRLTIRWDDDGPCEQVVVLRVRPHPPGLLEPYDLRKQYRLLRVLEPTPVRSPKALWYEETGSVLGREFFVMELAEGEVFERQIPAELADDPVRARRMSEALVDELAAIHQVDIAQLDFLGDGSDFLERELAHWTSEMGRVQRGPLPALELLASELERRRPAPTPFVTLVHGDPKPGNFAFVGDRLNATFDWEMATVGDPMADVAYAQLSWQLGDMFTSLPSWLSIDELVDRYERLTGTETHDLAWYRAFQGYKLAVILLLGSMLFDAGHTDDERLAFMGYGVEMCSSPALAELGIGNPPESGAVLARPERFATVRR
jgi:aminoglycoside phosphotransferase (APT) family kinase protein